MWIVQNDTPRPVNVRIRLRCAKLYAGSTFWIVAGKQRLTGTVQGKNLADQECIPASPPGGALHWQHVGAILLPAGKTHVSLSPTRMPYGYIFAEVEAVELQPV